MADRNSPAGNRRIHRTRTRLHGALASLIREKNYGDIAVREILDRAEVGRSTFYVHYGDKDELLESTVRDLVAGARPSQLPPTAKYYEKLIAFGLPLFEHIDRHRRDGSGSLNTGNRVVLHEHLRAAIAGWTAEAVHDFPMQGKRNADVSASLLAGYVASTFILVLDWWLDRQPTLSAKEVHDVFRELVTPTLAAVWSGSSPYAQQSICAIVRADYWRRSTRPGAID